jgi:putative DNA primase/helicase
MNLRSISATIPSTVTRIGPATSFRECGFKEREGRAFFKVELRPHDPKSYLRHCLEVDYDPHATCPQYDQAIREIFSRSPDPKRLISFWHDLMGYAIQPDRRIALILIFRGEGNDGKTVLIETLVRLIGQALVAAMRVQELETNRFAVGSLFREVGVHR